MTCRICKRQARGFGHAHTRFPIGDPRRYPLDWVFCSRRCQDAFHVLYGNRQRLRERSIDRQEVTMIDASDIERAAMRLCLKAFGAAAGDIGFDKPLGDYSEAEALRVIDAIVTRYTDAMVEQHEASRHPPVRGLKPTGQEPLIDFDDDIPF